MGELPASPCPHHRKLPAELNREIYLCFNLATRRKFICGLGWDFYFRHQLLTKTKRVCNPGNGWNRTITDAIVSRGGLRASAIRRRTNIYADKGFAISGEHSRTDSFPGTIIYYYEVKLSSESCCRIGLSNGTPTTERIGDYPNSYAISTGYRCNWYHLAGELHPFQLRWGRGIIRSKLRDNGMDVYGCGLVMDPNNKLAIFFTLNGSLIDWQIPISPSVDQHHLYPAVTFVYGVPSIEANFGNEKDKPFKYDIKKYPGMELEWI